MSQNTMPPNGVDGFDTLGLNRSVLSALDAVGYTHPTPIQARAIPLVLAGTDIIGQAKTGTGKTAAFALPLLSRIDLANRRPQVLVLTPTRELAIQVADSFKTYGRHLPGLNVLAVYGGQSYGIQLNQLKRGVHVVVGTPGRLMDHLKRKTVTFADLFCRVLDEADEMLHMGFIDDVEWILKRTPESAGTALFSATMPGPVQKIANQYLIDPETILIRPEKTEIPAIRQQFWMAKGASKAVALVRFLSAASHDGVIVFVKTKSSTLTVAKNLEENGFDAEALNGDMAQAARERTIHRFKNGRIDILVATDVAARGLDVDRISHVINYDMPGQADPYIHRIGRTGRAGRTGEALLFVGPRERWMVRKLEKATGQPMTEVFLPSHKAVNKKRMADFKARIGRVVADEELTAFESLVEDVADEHGIPMARVAAALARMTHGDSPLLLMSKRDRKKRDTPDQQPVAANTARDTSGSPKTAAEIRPAAEETPVPPESGMERYRIEVGKRHGVKARDIVGAIANEAGLESRYIRGIRILPEFSLVDLPEGMPREIFRLLKRTWVRSRRMAISKYA